MNQLKMIQEALMSKDPRNEIIKLKETGVLDVIPELIGLQDIEQNPLYHPEGNAFEHTLCVIDGARILLDEYSDVFNINRRNFMTFALLHDIGKLTTTSINKKGAFSHIFHEFEGGKMNREILTRLGADEELIEYVCAMTKLHMYPHKVQIMRDIKIERLVDKINLINVDCPINELMLFGAADRNIDGTNAKDILIKGQYKENLNVFMKHPKTKELFSLKK